MAVDDTHVGIIIRIYLKNFVTYDEVTVRPGRKLNLIIGPNGTGKSTIVSAIVLGLGGKTSVLARASRVGDYVKAGKTSAIIEIELEGSNNDTVVIKRTFNNESHTTWALNGKVVGSKQIQTVTENLNIQVDNLCQFLPQDRVQDFSKMEPKEILVETERSVDDSGLLESHQKLKEYRKVQETLEKDLESKSNLYNSEKQRFEAMKEAVGQIEEQRKVKKKLEVLKQKKAWVLYENKREEFATAKIGRDAAASKMMDLEKKLKPIKAEISKIEASIQQIQTSVRNSGKETAARQQKLNTTMDNIEQCEGSISRTEISCEQRLKQEQDREREILETKQQKDKVENDLQQLIDSVGSSESLTQKIDETAPKINKCKKEQSEITKRQLELKGNMQNIDAFIRKKEADLKFIQNVERKRLDILKAQNSHALEAVYWLRANKDKFSHPIHEPMLLTLNVKSPKYAKYFENTISARDLTAFVCEDKNDMNLLIKYLRTEKNLKINVVHSDPLKEVNMAPRIPLSEIKQFGFENYLVDLIEAPVTIMKYIVTMFRLNDIPIGSEKVCDHLDDLPRSLNRFFTTKYLFSVNYSRYTGEKSVRQSSFSDRSLLNVTLDSTKLIEINNNIKQLNMKKNEVFDHLKSVNKELADKQKDYEDILARRTQYRKDYDNIKGLKARIERYEQKVNDLENEAMSLEDIHKMYKKEVQDIILTQIKYFKQHNKIVNESYKGIIENEELKLKLNIRKNILSSKKNDSHELSENYSIAEKEYKELEKELEPLKVETRRLFDAAKQSIGGSLDDNKALKAIFAKLPPTVEELFEEIRTTQAKLYCLSQGTNNDRNVMETFHQLKRNMSSLKEKLDKQSEEHTKITAEIDRVYKDWKPKVDELVQRINYNFSNYFVMMKCVGEVSLGVPENPMDFEQYGFDIKVKFRDSDELQKLTRNLQSGGERAVTTAIYMLSLQELTKVPFRVVDEINQGMDAVNERKVFELIVKVTSENNSQHFLLTPKLLPGLKYTDSVSVLTIFNGKFMLPSDQFDIGLNYGNMLQAVKRCSQ